FPAVGGEHLADLFVRVATLSRKIADVKYGAVLLGFRPDAGEEQPFAGPGYGNGLGEAPLGPLVVVKVLLFELLGAGRQIEQGGGNQQDGASNRDQHDGFLLGDEYG